MKEYDCIVIGAGMAGLSSALKLAANGKKVLVLENQPVAGGVGTSFKRKGFTFESCLHFVDALAPGEEVRDFLDKYGVSEKVEYIRLNEFGRVIYPGHDFVVGNDFDSFKTWLIDNFPQDKAGIDEFFSGIAKFYKQFDHFMNAKIPLWLKLALSPVMYPLIIKTSCLSLEQFISKKIKDKRARSIIGTIWGFVGLPPSELSAFYFLIVLRGCWGKETAYIKGGFGRLFSAMAERIRECGSELKFNTAVAQIITENGGKVTGVRTDKGEEFRAKVIISNANAIDTLTRLIDSDPVKAGYVKSFSTMEKSVSAFTLYLGLDVMAKEVGMRYPLLSINPGYDHDQALKACMDGDYSRASFAVVDHSQLDPGLVPQGKAALSLMTFADHAKWVDLNVEEYAKKKKETAEAIMAVLEKYLPGLSKHVEYLEAATPKTMARYASLPEGAVYGFAQTVGQSSINRFPQKTKIKGLLLAGAWTSPGCGVHGCFVSGDEAADLALRQLR
jgi:prolycopene isomerase